jgi:hypothetical protein
MSIRSFILGIAAVAAVAATPLSPANASSEVSTHLARISNNAVGFATRPVVNHCRPSKYVITCM